MKKIILSFLVLIAFTFSGLAQNDLNTCASKVKTGKFKSIGKNTGSQITRTEKEQVEFILETQSTITSSVKWVSDTEYILKIKKFFNCEPGPLKKGDKIYVKIIACDATSYKCEVTFEGSMIGEIEYQILAD